MASATRGAESARSLGSCEKSLITIGSGWLVKSPIMSCKTCTNSTFVAGSVCSISERTSFIISSISRLRSFLSFTVKSPRFASVTADKPNSMPVRREVFSTSG